METRGKPAHSPEGEGKMLWVLDSLITFKLTGEDTNGEMTLMDSVIMPQSGPPPHIHEREDETFYVLEGEFEFMAGGETIRASPGSVVYGPRGIIHTYRNVGDEAGRFLTMITPSGLEDFFHEIGEPVTDPTTPPPITPEKIEHLLAIGPKYGLEIPPPPGE
ncbi:MAG: quercetin 2,3-dioxygenase [Actinomycetota bacterium]|jgi:quercetin dioxygenase-like cupin family protein|nr:quercetin 2,3-dioxygenase [Rubrobacter sp.]MDQ3506760.1 quercetin 2,3-dioxygenase [Actinomycetota bacterium]